MHNDANAFDPHTLFFSLMGVTEIEVLRAADWLIDVPLVGIPVRPFESATRMVRRNYDRLPPWWIVRRFGEFVAAWQIPEFSLGEARGLGSGEAAGVGGGIVFRAERLIDWTQLMIGDANDVAGRVCGRRGGVVSWDAPARPVDGLQWLVLKTFNQLTVVSARAVSGALTAVEWTTDEVLKVGRQSPHPQQTVFLRLPVDAYRAHELWFLDCRPPVVVGTVDQFAQATHAALAHRPHTILLDDRTLDRLQSEGHQIVVMTTRHVIAHAPDSLKSYVVPADWVLNGSDGEPSGRH